MKLLNWLGSGNRLASTSIESCIADSGAPKKKQWKHLPLLLILVLTFSPLALIHWTMVRASSLWYVSPSGNDTNNCQSINTACRTIAAAIVKAAVGDTVNVDIGVYYESLAINNRTYAVG